MDQGYRQLVSLMLPAGVMEYFDLMNVEQGDTGIKIYLEEKNIVPYEYRSQKLHSKGFMPEVEVQDFPIRNQKVLLCIKRRRWEVVSTGEIITRNWTTVRERARITSEFGLFLKAVFG